MNKEDLLREVKDAASARSVSRGEVIAAYDAGAAGDAGAAEDAALTKHLGIAEILYYVGGAIVFFGVAILVFQNWDALSPFSRAAVTLGTTLAAYVLGLVFGREKRLGSLGSALHLVAALVMPVALYVLFDAAGFDTGNAGVQTLMSLAAFGFFLLSYLAFRKNIFVLWSIFFGTWLFFALTGFMVGGNPIFGWQFAAYRALAAGASYLLFGWGFSRGTHAPLSGFLYGFGILGFLGAAFALGGWFPSQNIFWELVFPGLALASLFAGIPLRSRAFLTFGALYLAAYIMKITSEYFASGFGWPLALVLAGLMLIAVGYLYVHLKTRYAAPRPPASSGAI